MYKISNRSFLNFSNGIKKIIDLYKNHNLYVEKDVSITRVFAWWCKNNDILDLLKNKDKKLLISEYKKKLIIKFLMKKKN